MTKDKMCMFFASDYHFEMISLLSIKREIEKGNQTIIIPENDLTKTVNTVLSRVNFSEEEKGKIKEIDWSNKDKIKKIDKIIKEGREVSIYIKGGEKYVKEKNKMLNEIKNKDGIQIIDCYDITQMNENIEKIKENYKEQLMTKE